MKLTYFLSLLALSLPLTLSQAQKKKNPRVNFDEVWKTQNIEVPASPVAREAANPGQPPTQLEMSAGMHIGFVGGGLGSRMNEFSEFETELHRRYPELNLYIRNLCHEGDTPVFRPHPSRGSYTVVPGAEKLIKKEYQNGAKATGHYETPDQWLKRHKIDTVIGFFGYGESFDGLERLDGFKKELRAFIKHSLKQNYSGKQIQLAIVGPQAFEDLSATYDLPDGVPENARLQAYSTAMAEVCNEEGVLYIDAFKITSALYSNNEEALTINGHNLTRDGYRQFAGELATGLFGAATASGDYKRVLSAITAKNKLWVMDYKIPNGVHVHGRRFAPYGDKNYPTELRKIREMTQIRDRAIWAANKGETYDVVGADKKTTTLKEIKTNSNRPNVYKSGEEVADLLEVAKGFKVELFASEEQFPDLKNPSQMAFDNQGRLWVGCMGTYPHYRIGDPLPNDKILIFEDTNGDNKADKQIVFVDKIHIPMGFEITEKGVFVSLGKNLVLFEDTDGDSKADKRTVVLSGFDDHDTHHAISSFCADPSGAFYMAEGVFSHSNVETPYGTVRGTNGGFYRYNPNKMRLERTCQINIPNPWGIAFNDWGQNFFLFTSGAKMSWMQQAAIKPKYGRNLTADDLLTKEKVRPTSGLEFVSSRHFPDEMQGDILLCNNIGFLGCKQHKIIQDDKTGFFRAEFRQNLFNSSKEYQYFRPVDLEFAPDGSLYFVDWCNVLIGHMQHNARDPKRDKVHGRVYRVTYPSRPLVKPAPVAGASIEQLLENLKEPENRTRYRTRRELRGRDADQVLAATQKWVAGLDKSDERYDHHVLEALWVTWGINRIDQSILEQTIKSKNFNARAAAVRATRYNSDKVENLDTLLINASSDRSPLVRHEAMVAATWLGGDLGKKMIAEIEKVGVDKVSASAFKYAKADLGGEKFVPTPDKHETMASGITKKSKNDIRVQVNCVHEGLKFDFEKFRVKKGQKVYLTLNNPDIMQHNLVVVKPGTDTKVANEAIALGADGFKKHFVPDSKDVIVATKLLNEGEKETITYTFNEPGNYPYICTFPGHAQPMRGVIIVK